MTLPPCQQNISVRKCHDTSHGTREREREPSQAPSMGVPVPLPIHPEESNAIQTRESFRNCMHITHHAAATAGEPSKSVRPSRPMDKADVAGRGMRTGIEIPLGSRLRERSWGLLAVGTSNKLCATCFAAWPFVWCFCPLSAPRTRLVPAFVRLSICVPGTGISIPPASSSDHEASYGSCHASLIDI